MGAREHMLAATVPTEDHEIGGETVTVSGLTTAGRDAIEAAAQAGETFRTAILRACCSVGGAQLFEADDDVGSIPADITEPLVDSALRLAAFTSEEVAELEGN